MEVSAAAALLTIRGTTIYEGICNIRYSTPLHAPVPSGESRLVSIGQANRWQAPQMASSERNRPQLPIRL